MVNRILFDSALGTELRDQNNIADVSLPVGIEEILLFAYQFVDAVFENPLIGGSRPVVRVESVARRLRSFSVLHEADVDEWRSRIAVVRQDPFVFNDTLRYNLTIGNRDVSQDELDEVVRIARVNEFFGALPDGYDTQLGDDGVRLSGGQRQRVALARALLKDADG